MISIIPVGIKRTYDLIEVTPTHNFFAGGILVSNSNFGQHPRDLEIAEHLVETKKTYGFPDKFRTCFGKNTDEKIFKVATTLHSADLEKGITLARQSNDEQTLKNINRQNISLATYRNLQVRFNDREIPVYVELILGLPGETVESWKKGIDDCLVDAGGRNSLFIYLCQIFPNTEMADPEYWSRHGIETCRVKLQEIHGAVRGEGWVDEYEEVVVGTASMPHKQWREMVKFSWATMLLHSMKTGFFVLGWLWDRFKIPPSEFIGCFADLPLKEWDSLLDRMMEGEGRGTILLDCGDIYWDVEEAALLELSKDWDSWAEFLVRALKTFMQNRGILCDYEEVAQIVAYQRVRLPSLVPLPYKECLFGFNIPEYFDKLGGSTPIALERKPQRLILRPKDFGGDRERFARETVLWGRKSGTMLVPCEWEDVGG